MTFYDSKEDDKQEELSYWERFDRLQRTANLPAGPRGVFRFKTFEEFNEWKEKHKRLPKENLNQEPKS